MTKNKVSVINKTTATTITTGAILRTAACALNSSKTRILLNFSPPIRRRTRLTTNGPAPLIYLPTVVWAPSQYAVKMILIFSADLFNSAEKRQAAITDPDLQRFFPLAQCLIL